MVYASIRAVMIIWLSYSTKQGSVLTALTTEAMEDLMESALIMVILTNYWTTPMLLLIWRSLKIQICLYS